MTRTIGQWGASLFVALFMAGLALLATAEEAVAQSADPRLQETRERIARGETLYNAEDFSGALVEFQRAGELLEGHPLQHLATYNIGRCYERLFRYDQALIYYRQYLTQAGPDAADRAEVIAKIGVLDGLLATVHLAVNIADYEVWVDERNLGRGLTEILIPGGSHVVEVRATGYQAGRQEVNAPARTEQSLTFELEALGEGYQGLHWAYFAVATGLAVATVAVGAVFGGLAISESNYVEEQSQDPILGWLVTQADLDHISTLALTADILYGGAALFAIAAVVLAFFTNWGGDNEDATAEGATSLRISPVFGQGIGGISLGGSF